jgi:hypothetical protein
METAARQARFRHDLVDRDAGKSESDQTSDEQRLPV